MRMGNVEMITFYNMLIVIPNNVFYVGAKNNFNIVIIISKKLITLTSVNIATFYKIF